MMTRNEIVEKLTDVLARVMGKDSMAIPNENAKLAEDIGLNSIGVLYAVMGIEETFHIRFENVGVNDFKTVKDVVDYIEGKISV